MSDYQREQLLTYVGGPILVILGLYLVACGIMDYAMNAYGHVGMSITGAVIGLVCLVYGLYVIRAGRRLLAGNHWRAEHFQA